MAPAIVGSLCAVATASCSVRDTPATATSTLPASSTSAQSTGPTGSTLPSPSASGQSGSALALAAGLPVKGRAPKTGYRRAQFGTGWLDPDHNGCDARNDALRRTLTDIVMRGSSSCLVASGVLHDPYTGQVITFVRGAGRVVDIDHMVSLSDAWQTGAQQLTPDQRREFANDPLNLQPTGSATNEAKGDGDTATWLPPNRAYRCDYVARQAAVKAKYGLWVTSAERDAMVRILATCPDLPVPTAPST